MATHSSILAYEIPSTKGSGRLQSMGSKRVGHNQSDLAHPLAAGQGLLGEENVLHESETLENLAVCLTHCALCMCRGWMVPPHSRRQPPLFLSTVPSSQSTSPHIRGSISVVGGWTSACFSRTHWTVGLACNWQGVQAASSPAAHFCIPSGWASPFQDSFVFKMSFLTDSKSKHLLLEVEWMLGPHPRLFIMGVRLRQSQRGCLGQSAEHSRPAGRGLGRTAPRGVGVGKGLEGCRWWGCQGGRLWVAGFFFLCTPNKLRLILLCCFLLPPFSLRPAVIFKRMCTHQKQVCK